MEYESDVRSDNNREFTSIQNDSFQNSGKSIYLLNDDDDSDKIQRGSREFMMLVIK